MDAYTLLYQFKLNKVLRNVLDDKKSGDNFNVDRSRHILLFQSDLSQLRRT